MEHACDMEEGQVLSQMDGVSQTECAIVLGEYLPFCYDNFAYGGKDIYNGWMKNEKSAMISCNDGFRPVSFLIEALEEEAD